MTRGQNSESSGLRGLNVLLPFLSLLSRICPTLGDHLPPHSRPPPSPSELPWLSSGSLSMSPWPLTQGRRQNGEPELLAAFEVGPRWPEAGGRGPGRGPTPAGQAPHPSPQPTRPSSRGSPVAAAGRARRGGPCRASCGLSLPHRGSGGGGGGGVRDERARQVPVGARGRGLGS